LSFPSSLGREVPDERIPDRIAEQLMAYKTPAPLQFVADLPKTSMGKIMRRELSKFDA
jgi:acyl-coenzyme A synthetase/AMP-(fatty) acid ligase